MDTTTIIVAAIVFGFVGLSRSIQAASGKAPQPKPLTKKERWILRAIFWFFFLFQIAGVIFAMIADGMLDPKHLF